MRWFLIIGLLFLTGCTVTPQQLGLSNQEWQAMSPTEQQKTLAAYRDIKKTRLNSGLFAGTKISVEIEGGTAMMPPFTTAYAYEPIQLILKPGQCRRAQLVSTDAAHHVNLRTCYNGLTLALDPSRYDPNFGSGSLRFNYHPIWQRGLTYRGINSSGYVRLTGANITIKTLEAMPDAKPPVAEKLAPVEDVTTS